MNTPPAPSEGGSAQVSVTWLLLGNPIQLIARSPDHVNYIADMAPVQGTPVTWTLRMAPDETGVTLDYNGMYLTSKILLLADDTSSLLLSTDPTKAVHLITGNSGTDGMLSLARETDLLLLSYNPNQDQSNPMRVGFQPTSSSFIQAFQGSSFAPPPPAQTLHNLVPLPPELFNGESVLFGSSGLYFAVQQDGTVTATGDESTASRFTVTAGTTAGSATISSGNLYMVVGADGSITMVATAAQATAFMLSATDTKGIAVATTEVVPRYWNIDTSGRVRADVQLSWSTRLDFLVELEPMSDADRARLYGIELATLDVTPCQMAVATLVWQTTGGLFLAAGLGPGLISSTPSPGFVALISQNPSIGRLINAIVAKWDTLVAVEKAFAAASATYAIGAALWEAGIFWDALKFLAPMAGWYAFYQVACYAVEMLVAPEAAVVAQVASLVTWFGQVIQSGINIIGACGSSAVPLSLASAPAG